MGRMRRQKKPSIPTIYSGRYSYRNTLFIVFGIGMLLVGLGWLYVPIHTWIVVGIDNVKGPKIIGIAFAIISLPAGILFFWVAQKMLRGILQGTEVDVRVDGRGVSFAHLTYPWEDITWIGSYGAWLRP